MRTLRPFAWGLLASLVVGIAPSARAGEAVSCEQFGKLHALIKPHAAEQKWTRTPWLADLWEARRQAAAQGKPILLWEMDGHPLGCT